MGLHTLPGQNGITFISVMQNTLRSPHERATEKMTTKEVNFSWELAQPRLRQWLYEKGRQDFFIILLRHPTSFFAKTPTPKYWVLHFELEIVTFIKTEAKIMNNKQTFSAFVLTYNDAIIAQKAIQSLANQNIDFKEFIVHDDCSNQENKAILENLQQRFPQTTFIFGEKNKGVIESITTCLKLCTGDWVVSVSSDDELCPDILKEVEYMANLNPNSGLIFGDSINHDGNGNFTGIFEHKKHFHTGYTSPDSFLKNYMMKVSAFNTTGAATVWKRDVLLKLWGKHASLGPYIDTFITRVIGLTYGVCYLGKALKFVTVAPTTFSQKSKGSLTLTKQIYTSQVRAMYDPEYKKLFTDKYIRHWKTSYILRTTEYWIKKAPFIGLITSKVRQLIYGDDKQKVMQALSKTKG